MDLFEDYEHIPEELKAVCDKWQQKAMYEGLDYNDCAIFRKNAKPSAIRLITGWMQILLTYVRLIERAKLENQTINNQKIWNWSMI